MRLHSILILSILAGQVDAQSANVQTPAAIQTIREQDLRRDLFTMAGDPLRGREAGTLDEMRASIWTAEQLRKIGLEPMGEEGTFFQWFNMRRTRLSTVASSVRIGGKPFVLWTDITPASNNVGDVVGTTVFAGDGSDSTIDVRGRVAVVTLRPTSEGTRTTINTPEYRAVRQGITVQSAALTRRGAAAVIVVADSLGESNFDAVATLQSRGAYTVIGGANRFAPAGRAGGGGGRGGRGGGGLAQPAAGPGVVRASLGAVAAPRKWPGRRDPPQERAVRYAEREHHRRGPRNRSGASQRVRRLQLAPGPRRRSLCRRRRFHLERRRRQRLDERRAVRDRARVGEAAVEALGALHLSRRRGARLFRLALARGAPGGSAVVDGGGAQRRHDRPQPSRHRVAHRACNRRTGTRPRWCRWRSTPTTGRESS